MYQAELYINQDKRCVLSELASTYDESIDIEIEELHDHNVTFVLSSDSYVDDYERTLLEAESVENVGRLSSERLIVTKESCGAYHAVCRNHGVLRRSPNQIAPSQRLFNVLVFQREDLKAIVEDFREIGSVTLGSLTEVGSTHTTLTDRQREVVERALEAGYFDWPRDVTGEELASELGISRTTFLEHLRKAERKILADSLDRETAANGGLTLASRDDRPH